jgi:hypothetical protein
MMNFATSCEIDEQMLKCQDDRLGALLPDEANHRILVQPRLQKYSGSLLTQITCTSLAIPSRFEQLC